MRKFVILLAVVLTALSLISYSQEKMGKISGTVIDGNAKTIESATITLLKSKDSSVIKLSVADKTGKFAFEAIPEGKYIVSITAVGHQKGFSETFEISPTNSSVILKTIELVPVAKSIEGVTV